MAWIGALIPNKVKKNIVSKALSMKQTMLENMEVASLRLKL